ncbi:uncharacterized protein (TIGR03083 family) [Nocardioides thalensis]|uniref:Uncharacterized protein (TIGR03083 family) n=1 Tax=Nocardioides thalensis TaxID=1914755 RepID=A0A853C8C7_9ACTN|nr:maleylpyruvate isomerase N-terminal domain-containing protein [Nocardioides thalensis]NYJ02473.1 uncharacterized protein (TIGR03083 family) [Nocardioides thalensis]
MTHTEPVLREQWRALRSWLADERVLDLADQPSGLGAWTVRDLVVHLGYGLHMVAEVIPAPDRDPISLASYVAGYHPAQHQIADDTTGLARSLRGRELAGIDELAAEAWRSLDDGFPAVVLGRRGPLRGDDFLLTRLLELVTHGDDLHRVVGSERPSPLVSDAVGRVADALSDAYEQSAGRSPRWSGLDLVRVATGRASTDDLTKPLLS